MPINMTNMQFGVFGSGFNYSIAAPSGGAVVSEPVNVPGGLLGLMCPNDILLISGMCNIIASNPLNTVTAVVEPAGDPSDFNLFAGIQVGKPILSLPVKIHLKNPLLGPNCYIGSNSNPIVLQPENLVAPQHVRQTFEGDGTPSPKGDMYRLKITGKLGDDSFAVPKAHGCGPWGLADFAVNAKLGLPSPEGSNSLVLKDAKTYLAGLVDPKAAAPNAGKVLSKYWHSAVQQ